jgi:hypothetical protein
VGETRTLNPTLPLSSVSSNVTVEAAIPDLNLANAEVGGVITGAQTEELPVNGRYWASLEALIPGAISAGTGTQDQIRFSGLSQEDNNFRFDGVDATGLNHAFVKVAMRLQFPLESIAEFKASSAAYSADIGGMAGGQISMVSRSGTVFVMNPQGTTFHLTLYGASTLSRDLDQLFLAGSWLTTAAPALLTTSSCESAPPEQPIAPIILPCSISGMPPRDAMTPSNASR